MSRGGPARPATPRWSSGRRRRRGRTATTSEPRAVITLSGSPSRKSPCHNFSEARPSANNRSSPGQPSLCGASMPAATHHAPGSSPRCTRTVQPSRAARRATERPMTPPPMTANDFLRHSLPPFAGMTRIRCDGKGRFRVPTLSPRFPGLPCRRPTLLSRCAPTPRSAGFRDPVPVHRRPPRAW